MPNISDQLKYLLNLQAGDVVISELPFEDAQLEDFKPVASDNFVANHISIYTGDFAKPFAHSLQEGHKLPGVRLTKQWDGRHIVFRLKNTALAIKSSEIARRWAIATSSMDFAKFAKTYPELTWEEQYEYYKKEYFSLPNSVVSSPATPYDLDRANLQLITCMREPSAKDFNEKSLRRAIKFAARSELFQQISRGLRCTSFVINVYQAAAIESIVKKVANKFSFKELNVLDLNKFFNTVLVAKWQETELGKNLQAPNYRQIFPEGVLFDSKYTLPVDIFSALQTSEQWETVGTFALFKDNVIHSSNLSLSMSSVTKPPFSPINILSHPSGPSNLGFITIEQRSRSEDDSALALQVAQIKRNKKRVLLFSTPKREDKVLSPRSTEGLACVRKLFG